MLGILSALKECGGTPNVEQYLFIFIKVCEVVMGVVWFSCVGSDLLGGWWKAESGKWVCFLRCVLCVVCGVRCTVCSALCTNCLTNSLSSLLFPCLYPFSPLSQFMQSVVPTINYDFTTDVQVGKIESDF